LAPIYEVVSGQILLSKREEFFRLHREILLPMMKSFGIEPVLMLICELGEYGRFLDVYRYESLADYECRTDELLAHPDLPSYYARVGGCVHGGIRVEIMRDLPYSAGWVRSP
jgi:hypothetical protein